MDALSAVCILEEAELVLEMQDIRDLFGVNDLTLQAAIPDTVITLACSFPLPSVSLAGSFLLYYSICAFSCFILFSVLSSQSHWSKGQSHS